MQQRVFITAAAAGIGRAIARAFYADGAHIHICDIDKGGLQRLADELPGLSYSITDVGDERQVEQFFRDGLEQLGGIDVLVNNAGIGGPAGKLEDLDSDAWQQTIQLNLNSTFYCCKQALPQMKAQGSGAVINLSSTAGIMGYPLRTPYAAAKWAVTGLTKSLAREVSSRGVRVNAVAPGPINTELVRALSKDWQTAKAAELPLGRFGEPEDVAATVAFLASDDAKIYVGQTLGPNSGDVML